MSIQRIYNGRGLLVVALGLAALLQALIIARSPLIAWDGITFIEMAQSLAADPWATMRAQDQHPGYPAMIWGMNCLLDASGLMSPASAWIMPARLVTGLFGLAAIVLLWLLADHIAGRAVANASALLLAVLPVMRENAADALSDSPHLAFYLASAWLLVVGIARRQPWTLALAGACSGLAFLIRPEGLSVAIVGVGYLLATYLRRPRLERQRPLALVALVLGASVVTLPYVLGTGKLTSKVTSKPGWQALQARAENLSTNGNTVGSSAAVRHAEAPTGRGLSELIERLGWAASTFGLRMAECWRYLLLVPLIAGIPIAMRRVPAPTSQLLLALTMTYIGLLLLLFLLGGYMERRHLMPLVALLTPTVVLGLARLIVAAGERRRLVAIAVGAVLAAVLIPRAVRPIHDSQLHKIAAIQYLERDAEPDDRLMSNAIHLLFYASRMGNVERGKLLRRDSELTADDLTTHRFVALEVDSPQDAHWVAQLDRSHTRRLTLSSDPSRGRREIVIFDTRPDSGLATGPQFTRQEPLHGQRTASSEPGRLLLHVK